MGCGVWLFRGALQGKNLFSSLDVAGDWERAVPCDSSCTCSYAYGHGPAIGPHTGERCWPLLAGVWRAISPLMKPDEHLCLESVEIPSSLFQEVLVTSKFSDGGVSPVLLMKELVPAWPW